MACGMVCVLVCVVCACGGYGACECACESGRLCEGRLCAGACVSVSEWAIACRRDSECELARANGYFREVSSAGEG